MNLTCRRVGCGRNFGGDSVVADVGFVREAGSTLGSDHGGRDSTAVVGGAEVLVVRVDVVPGGGRVG